MKSKFLPILILLIGATAALFLIWKDFKKQNESGKAALNFANNNEAKNIIENSAEDFKNQISPLYKGLEDVVRDSAQFSSSTLASSSNMLEMIFKDKDTEGNLTELLGLLIAKELIKSQEEAKSAGINGNMISLNPSRILESAKQFAPDIEQTWKKYFVSDKNIKISENNGKEAILHYIKEGAEIMTKHFKNIQNNSSYVKNIISKNDRDKINALIANFDLAIADFKKLETPSSFLDFQKEQINLLIIQKKILEDIYNAPQDPIRAYLVMGIFDDILNQHRQLISKMNQKLLSLGIQ